jgi:hypothetical protein
MDNIKQVSFAKTKPDTAGILGDLRTSEGKEFMANAINRALCSSVSAATNLIDNLMIINNLLAEN